PVNVGSNNVASTQALVTWNEMASEYGSPTRPGWKSEVQRPPEGGRDARQSTGVHCACASPPKRSGSTSSVERRSFFITWGLRGYSVSVLGKSASDALKGGTSLRTRTRRGRALNCWS